MRIRVISDVHGAVEPLAAAARDSDALVVLGDLLNVLDYRSMDGILVDVFGREPVAEAAGLRASGRFDEARAALRRHAPDPDESRARFAELAREEYARIFAALPAGAIVTYGNVDLPDLMRELAPSTIRFVDGEVVELAGRRWGIVGGGVSTPLGVPGEVGEAAWEAKLDRLGTVDLIGTHMPPRVPWYCYDLVGKRFEPGSTALLGFIVRRQPRYSLFGHVHHPMVGHGNIGRTELINVGPFRETGAGWTLEEPEESGTD